VSPLTFNFIFTNRFLETVYGLILDFDADVSVFHSRSIHFTNRSMRHEQCLETRTVAWVAEFSKSFLGRTLNSRIISKGVILRSFLFDLWHQKLAQSLKKGSDRFLAVILVLVRL